jgi:hypothetical protein
VERALREPEDALPFDDRRGLPRGVEGTTPLPISICGWAMDSISLNFTLTDSDSSSLNDNLPGCS